MAKEDGTSKLKLVHLLWMIVVAIFVIGVAWGVSINQQGTNTTNIKTNTQKVGTNREMLIRIDTRQEVVIEGQKTILEKIEKISK